MSGTIADSPVSFNSNDLNPCTAYVNGSTLAMARSHTGNASTGKIDPLGKNNNVFRIPKIARGTSGSSIRTIIKNIIVLNATEVSTIITNRPPIVPGLNIVPTPDASDPTTVITTPVITALIAPAPFSPNTSYDFVIGVTRYPSWTPRALSSIYNIPPPIITDTNIASVIDPGSRYFMYSIYGYSSTTSSAVCCNSRGDTSGWFNAFVTSVIFSSNVELMKLSLLSTISAIRG